MKDIANLALFACLDGLGYNTTPVTPQVLNYLHPPVLCATCCDTVPAERQTQPLHTAQVWKFMAGRVSASPLGTAGDSQSNISSTSDISPPPICQVHLGKWWTLKQMLIISRIVLSF